MGSNTDKSKTKTPKKLIKIKKASQSPQTNTK